MGLKNYLKKSAFTLAEVVIALFIIGILAMITLPVINRQLEKTDEYAYYMAFKTVEKMASQVVTLGEPYSDDVSLIPEEAQFPKYGWRDALAFKFKMFFNDISTKVAYTERTIRRKLFPKSIAAQQTELDTDGPSPLYETDDFVSDIWLGYRVCSTPENTVPFKSVITKDEIGRAHV